MDAYIYIYGMFPMFEDISRIMSGGVSGIWDRFLSFVSRLDLPFASQGFGIACAAASPSDD